MRINIESEAQNYIRRNSSDNSITIDLKTRGGGWQTFYQPSVKVERPEDQSKYDIYEEKGIKIYIAQGIRAKKGGLMLRLSEYLGEDYIYVEGMAL